MDADPVPPDVVIRGDDAVRGEPSDTPGRREPAVRRRAWQGPERGVSQAHAVTVLGQRSPVSVSGPTDARIGTLAALQRGRVARRQLLSAGISASTVTRRLASGRLTRVGRGVYAVGHAAPAPGTRETEALLALREGALISHESALVLWDLHPAPPIVHVSVVGSAAGRPAGTHVHRPVALRTRDARTRDGLPVTSPSRALCESAARLPIRELVRAVEAGLRRGLTSERELREQLDAGTLHQSARARMRSLLGARTGSTFTRSEAEERFLALVREGGLPEPLCNARRHGYEIDFLWPAARLAVEIDGWAFHGGYGSFRGDRRKDSDLWQRGRITVVRLTWPEIVDERIATIVRIGQMLAAAPG